MRFPKFGRGVRKAPGAMNGWERKYSATLEARKQTGEILWWAYEAVKLKLADKTYLTPDFVVMLADGAIEFHEVKGFMRDDAAVKLKVAANKFPFIFRLITQGRDKTWSITEV